MYKLPQFRGVLLNVTDACNLACKYCFVHQHPHYMPYKIARDTLDLMVDISKETNVIPDIAFFGGEPTLCWDSIIEPLVEYRNKNNFKVHFGMTSNCTLLNENRLKFLRDNEFTLLFSIDGNKETQDFNRPYHDGRGSFDTIEPIISLIPKYLPNTTFRSTLYPPTCHNLYDNIMFASNQGFKSYYAMPDSFSQWTPEQIDILKHNLHKYSDYFIKEFREERIPIILTPISEVFKEFKPYFENKQQNIIADKLFPTCGLGVYYASVNYEGKIFGCQQTPTLAISENPYYIGNIYNGIDVDKHQKLLDMYLTEESECEDINYCHNICKIKPICQLRSCHSTAYSILGNLTKKTKIECIWRNMLFEEALYISKTLLEENNQLFMKTCKAV